MSKYALLIKTGESELRALDNISSKRGILPIVELTRGRITRNDRIGLVEKKTKRISEIFSNRTIIMDLTSERSLSSSEIEQLHVSDNGYENWINFLKKLKDDSDLENIYPALLLDPDKHNFEENFNLEVANIVKSFDGFAYRCDIQEDSYMDDVNMIKMHLPTGTSTKFYFIVDCSHIRSTDIDLSVSKSHLIIKEVQESIPNAKFIVTATSFPDTSSIGAEDHSRLKLHEVRLHEKIQEACGPKSIMYGDYGSINPIRNDNVMMRNGWRPRIDTPLAEEIFYYRRKKGSSYSDTYSLVARDAVKNAMFPSDLEYNWGVNQILNASEGAAPGASPSFWISVRMNIHIEQQQKRLGIITKR